MPAPTAPATPSDLRGALERQPGSVPLRLALGQACAAQGDGLQAAAWFADALRLAPGQRAPRVALAEQLLGLRLYDQALPQYRALHAAGDRDRATLLHLGFCLEHTGDVEAAVAAYRDAVEREPGFLEAHIDLAGVLWRVGDFDGALAHAQAAVHLAPEHPYALRILGSALMNANRLEEAEHWLRRALARQPGLALAELDLAFTLLLAGRWREGWSWYARRWNDTARLQRPAYWRPDAEWAGPAAQPLAGRRVLVYSEQGLGDTLQFARYLPLLQQQGAQVHLDAPAPLVRLLEHALPGVQCLRPGQPLQADLHAALLDLPLHLGTDSPEAVPAAGGYLQAPAGLCAEWAQRLAPWAGRCKLGIAWSGSPAQVNNRNRALPLSLLAPLLALPGVQGFSLQAGPADGWTDRLPDPGQLVDLTAHWSDFADSAAMLAQLDLVVTVDTAVAHLAGALGVPCWVLLPSNPDFRWLLAREDSPWYASVRLFRRAAGPGGRQAQAARVLAALHEALRRVGTRR